MIDMIMNVIDFVKVKNNKNNVIFIRNFIKVVFFFFRFYFVYICYINDDEYINYYFYNCYCNYGRVVYI